MAKSKEPAMAEKTSKNSRLSKPDYQVQPTGQPSDQLKDAHALQSESQITETLKKLLVDKLQSRQYPKTICPSEIPRALSQSELTSMGVSEWRELMSLVRTILFDMRSEGQAEILQKGQVIPPETTLGDTKGPIRARLVPSDGD
ncbi:MAG: hypothetical protein Q9213_007935 [Squamulea squamosa]